MLDAKGLKLDAVIELKVDSSILHKRIANRVAETAARGEPLRPDDNADVLRRRIEAYREQTAPLVDYYSGLGALTTVDGMAEIAQVARTIDEALGGPSTNRSAAKKTAPGRSAKPGSASPVQESRSDEKR